MVRTSDLPFMSEFLRGNGGGLFSFPLLAFCPSLVGLGASDMLVPVLEAIEEAASLVNVRGVRDGRQQRSHLDDLWQP